MKRECRERLDEIAEKFKTCQKSLSALGDETRQLIISTLLENDYNGIRVGEIARHTHLSRPAVSHHLQVLKEAGIVNMRKEGTKNYYYIDSNESKWKTLHELISLIYEGVQELNQADSQEDAAADNWKL